MIRFRRAILVAMLLGVLVTLPICIWGPERWYRPMWLILCVCCWVPALMVRRTDA